MEHLSSCYFCSSAVETPVRRYELPGQGDLTTVTLCGTCSEKLDIVLETTGAGNLDPTGDSTPDAAVEYPADVADDGAGDEPDASVGSPVDDEREGDGLDDDPLDDGLGADEGAAVEEGDEVNDGLDDPFEDEELLPGEDPLADEADAVAADDELENGASEFEAGADAADDPGSFDGDGSDAEGTAEHADAPATDGADDGVDHPTEAAPGAEPVAEESTAGEPAEAEAVDEGPTADEMEEADPESAGEQSGTAEPDGDWSGTGDGDVDAGTDQTNSRTISALEYNRVMRMLQNREFPVDRDEIEIVASNAYDFTQSECAQVIDLAVERGLLEERDGELYRPQE